LVEIANRSNLINSFGSGIIQVDNHRLYKTPTYYAQLLYSTLAGTSPLRIESVIPPDAGLDLSATLDPNGRRLVLFAVNSTLQEIRHTVALKAFAKGSAHLTIWTLADRDHVMEPDVRNSFTDPERIIPRRSSIRLSSSKFQYPFPALSLTLFQLGF
jgi:alpha-L-arabinofuranosidase